MGVLGTRKFYKPFKNGETEEQNQILKNKGYISIILHSAYYNSKGNFWQNIFGGNDTIALTSSVTYKSNQQSIEAKTIVDKRTVKANRNHNLGLTRLIALKVPSTADGLELKLEFTSVKDDNLENGLNLMNSKEFQKPLEMASIPIGQILSITSVVKKIFSSVENPAVLETTFAGVISKDKVDNPIQKERLTSGYIIAISNNDEDNNFLNQIDSSKLTIDGDGLKYENNTVKHTNIVYHITFENLKGIDEKSNWFKKFQISLDKLDDIFFVESEEDRTKILKDSRRLWIEASAILSEDNTYISEEKRQIKATYFKKINERYNEMQEASDDNFVNMLMEDKSDNFNFLPNLDSLNKDAIVIETEKIATNYLQELGNVNLTFPE